MVFQLPKFGRSWWKFQPQIHLLLSFMPALSPDPGPQFWSLSFTSNWLFPINNTTCLQSFSETACLAPREQASILGVVLKAGCTCGFVRSGLPLCHQGRDNCSAILDVLLHLVLPVPCFLSRYTQVVLWANLESFSLEAAADAKVKQGNGHPKQLNGLSLIALITIFHSSVKFENHQIPSIVTFSWLAPKYIHNWFVQIRFQTRCTHYIWWSLLI